ncbi:DUF1294 domain-containing protein [Lysobacter sp. 5GHs7-4]|uniref:DUF1294 domain-containing protein n=1 Tax=Lysobacter sp. 5GHs7-4 TaxID=2904253 RepID=UPI001E5E1E9B|nr:DUF1294 domain-containing protein [Lysobacter sp. 5GHs7-4]UHQ23773.1 DUF1294 domain-containing protein [Lysobacter sp. 5GHs7-4]
MRQVGRISDWNEDKGYGFVVPHDGGSRAFVHAKAFQFGSRRPVDGDLISYATVKDGRGRTNAVDVRFAGQKIEARKPSRPPKPLPIPRLAIGLLFLLATVACAFLGLLPIVVMAGYLLMSSVSFLMYTLDKAAAGKDARRTPENTLHVVDLLGGWPGALIAQQLSRHKTIKASFQFAFWITVFANLTVVAWLVYSGVV